MGNALLFPGFVALTPGTVPEQPYATQQRHQEAMDYVAAHRPMDRSGIKTIMCLLFKFEKHPKETCLKIAELSDEDVKILKPEILLAYLCRYYVSICCITVIIFTYLFIGCGSMKQLNKKITKEN